MIGTVSPAGGNFEEPVTQSTLATVKAFLGLSYDRAYKRFYPAIDPLISWSRYLEQLKHYYDAEIGPTWTDTVAFFMALLKRGDDVRKMMQVTGEEGISLDDFVLYQKAHLLDMVYLQQDAYDSVDVSTPPERQQENCHRLQQLLEYKYQFDSKEKARDFFITLTGLLKNINYSYVGSPEYEKYVQEIDELVSLFL